MGEKFVGEQRKAAGRNCDYTEARWSQSTNRTEGPCCDPTGRGLTCSLQLQWHEGSKLKKTTLLKSGTTHFPQSIVGNEFFITLKGPHHACKTIYFVIILAHNTLLYRFKPQQTLRYEIFMFYMSFIPSHFSCNTKTSFLGSVALWSESVLSIITSPRPPHHFPPPTSQSH